jgi:ATP synthase, F1 delta subunit
MNNVSIKYAEALFDIAVEEDRIDVWQNQIRDVSDCFKEYPELKRVFSHVKIEEEEKRQLARDLFSHVDRIIMNFIQLLVDKNKLSNIVEITTEFNHLCNLHNNIEEGIVYSAYPLQETEIQEITQAVTKKMGKQVQLKVKIDSSLVLGIKVVVNDKVIDGSLRNRIDMLRNTLLKESR